MQEGWVPPSRWLEPEVGRDHLKSGFQSPSSQVSVPGRGSSTAQEGPGVKAGRLSLRHLALEESACFSVGVRYQPCTPTASLAFAGHNFSYEGPGLGCLYWVSGF